MQFTLGMPFLGVLGKFYRNRKGLKWLPSQSLSSQRLDQCVFSVGGGEVQIESHKVSFKEKVQPKVGSMDNVNHEPGGGNVKVSSAGTLKSASEML